MFESTCGLRFRSLDAPRRFRDNPKVVAVDDIVLPPPEEGVVLNVATLFDSPGPFEIEIGCGKGGFLLSRARAHPEVRLLGIEWANKFYEYAADRMARWTVTNVRVLRTDAKHFFLRHLPPACVSVLHLYHPDPWPKKRHHKRRLVQADFVEAALRAMLPGGRWLVQSDHAEYFEQIHTLLDGHPLLSRIENADARAFAGPEWSGTNFEIKYAREGRTIYRAAYEKRDTAL